MANIMSNYIKEVGKVISLQGKKRFMIHRLHPLLDTGYPLPSFSPNHNLAFPPLKSARTDLANQGDLLEYLVN